MVSQYAAHESFNQRDGVKICVQNAIAEPRSGERMLTRLWHPSQIIAARGMHSQFKSGAESTKAEPTLQKSY